MQHNCPARRCSIELPTWAASFFTQDKDLLREARLRQQEDRHFAGVIYAHQLRIAIGQCVNDLELICKVSQPEDFVRLVEYLPLK